MHNHEHNPSKRSYFKDFMFLIIFTVIILFYLALSSYSPLDPALNSVHFPSEPSNNLVGAWGANLSAMFVYILGIGAFLLPLPFFLTGVSYFKRTLSIKRSFIYFISPFFFYLSLIFFLWNYAPLGNLLGYDVSTLGLLGTYITDNFYAKLGYIGSGVLAVLFLSFAIMFFYNYQKFFTKILEFTKSFKKG